MIVFEYMYQMIEEVFGTLMDKWGKGERRDVETEYEIKVNMEVTHG